MKRKIALLLVLQCLFTWNAYCQEDREDPSEGYIKHAVPPFDNRTRQLDLNAYQKMPIRLYKPSGQNPPQQIRNDQNAVMVADNIDVQVFPSVDAQSEQHMTVSKINPGNIILSSNTPYYQGYYVSQNGGATWFGSDHMPDNIGTNGDPATAVNADGSLFLETIGTSGYKVFKSNDKGNTWPGPLNVTYSPSSFDKEMMAVDNVPGSPYLNHVYTAWTDFTNPYNVRFNRSIDGGVTYQPNIVLHNSWGQGTNVQTGPHGEVYVCWANYSTGSVPADGMGFSVSPTGGASFIDLTPVFAYAGIRVNGSDPLFNNTRVNDFPSMAVDKSCSVHRGRVYIAYPAKQNGNGKAVILVRYSDNQGTSWSSPVEVSIPAGRQNWFPWITVDDATGTVSVAYLSLDQATGFITNTYLAYSFNGGTAWSNIKVSDVGHTVASIPGFAFGYCGDYIANTAWANKNYVAWNDNRTGQWNNYVSRVDFSQLALFSSDTDININSPVIYTLPTAADINYQAIGNITSPTGGTFDVEAGASVTFIAGGHIIFKPGFIAKTGCHLDASVGTVTSCVNAVQMDNISEDISRNMKNLKPSYSGDAAAQCTMYPNPAQNEIIFEYLLPDDSEVSLTLMDLNGKEVMGLINRQSQGAGRKHFNADISSLKNGIYTYRLVTYDYVKTEKFVKAE